MIERRDDIGQCFAVGLGYVNAENLDAKSVF
jgi:hypothetical protein